MTLKQILNPKPPRCDYEGCECGHAEMELNGLRFVCTHHCTLEMHTDHYPIYYDAVKALRMAINRLLEDPARNHETLRAITRLLNVDDL